jgi:hypothetical protein
VNRQDAEAPEEQSMKSLILALWRLGGLIFDPGAFALGG